MANKYRNAARQGQDRDREMYERELNYFSELSSAGGSFQGTLNVSQNRLESYLSTADVAIAQVGETYVQTIQNLANSAADPMIGEEIRQSLARDKVLKDYGSGKVNYQFVFLRRRGEGGYFWGSTRLRSYLNPESGDIIMFFYTTDVTEQKLREQLLHQIGRLDYEVLTEVDIYRDTYRVLSLDNDREMALVPNEGFQKMARMQAECWMESPAREEYLGKLDYTYMKEQLEKSPVYSLGTCIFIRHLRAVKVSYQ